MAKMMELMRFIISKVKEIRLYDNRIGDAGLRELTAAVAGGALPVCAFIGLSKNRIGDDGMRELAAAVAGGALPVCETIYLNGNPGDQGPVEQALAQRREG